MNINDDVNFSIPSSSFNLPQEFAPVYHDSISTTNNIGNNNDKGSLACQTPIKLKNKKHQPKYRSTKRPPSERRFQCDHCESRFFTQKDVKRHLVVHTGLRNFACPYCTQKFGRKDHLVRHAKKSHGQDTRSFKRKNRLQNLNQPSNATESNQNKKTKRSKRSQKMETETDYIAVNEQSTFLTAPQNTANVTTTTSNTNTATSMPANFVNANIYNNGTNRIPTTSYDNFNNSVIMLSSTSPQLLNSHPKMTLVDNPTTSKFTASLSYSRNYPNCSNNYLNSSHNFNCNINPNNFNQFLPGTSHQQPAQMGQTSSDHQYYGNGSNYNKLSINNGSYANISPQLETPHFTNSNNVVTNSTASNNNVSFKAIASSIVDGFNTCIELEYNSVGMNHINEPHPSNITYPDSSNSRFHTQFK